MRAKLNRKGDADLENLVKTRLKMYWFYVFENQLFDIFFVLMCRQLML
jgi:hypothetical protein